MERDSKDFETLKTHIFTGIIMTSPWPSSGASLSAVRHFVRQDRETFQFSDAEFIDAINHLIEDKSIKITKLGDRSMAILRTRFDFFVDPMIAIART